MYDVDMIFQFYEHPWFIQSVNWVCNFSKWWHPSICNIVILFCLLPCIDVCYENSCRHSDPIICFALTTPHHSANIHYNRAWYEIILKEQLWSLQTYALYIAVHALLNIKWTIGIMNGQEHFESIYIGSMIFLQTFCQYNILVSQLFMFI